MLASLLVLPDTGNIFEIYPLPTTDPGCSLPSGHKSLPLPLVRHGLSVVDPVAAGWCLQGKQLLFSLEPKKKIESKCLWRGMEDTDPICNENSAEEQVRILVIRTGE